MTKDTFQTDIAPTLPHLPGVYRYYNSKKKLLYVGKAKDLKKRITSYFIKDHEQYKTTLLVAEIDYLEYTVTPNEHDAFLLENSLIKHFQPPYNINLKDDKTYPYIVIKKEHFPRVFLTRRVIKDGSEYIGPFTGVWRVKQLLDLIKQTIPLRTCSLNLSPGEIAKGKYKVCLEYHLGNCKGPCEGLQNEDDYKQNIADVRYLLKGNLKGIIQDLKTEMQQFAADLKFEQAQLVKTKIDALQEYQSQSSVVSARIGNLDVLSIINQKETAYINYMIVADGAVIHSKNIAIEKKLEDELPEDILSFAYSVLKSKFQSTSKELVVPFTISVDDADLQITIPKLGDRKKLLDMSFMNVEEFIRLESSKAKLLLRNKTEEENMAILEKIQDSLELPVLPTHIECFDNSNFQGSYPVASMVCFKNGVPSKKDYRRFHIKTVEGPNDFASMTEIVKRRYKRLLEENQPLPQLVIIDGGKGQLGAAMKSIQELGLIGRMTLVGLAKKEELLYFPGDSEPLRLPYNSPELLLIRRVRDEVHRFGITFHRETRSKGTIKNELEAIKGIGDKTATSLLQAFRSVSKIKELSLAQLSESIGLAKAQIVFSHFHNIAEK